MKLTNFETLTKKTALYIIERIRKEPIFKKLAELENNQLKGKLFIDELQLKKVKEICSFAFKYSHFYRAHFKKAGVEPWRIKSLSDFQNLPCLTKNLIKDNIHNIQTQTGRKLYPVKTSGSTGEPLKFYKDRISSAYTYASMYRGLKWHGVDICAKEAYLWGIPINRNEKIIAHIKDFILNRFRERAFVLSDSVNYEFYMRMKKQKPTILSGYSSLIYEFSRYIYENDLDVNAIRPKIIKFTAETLHSFQRELIEKVFGCPVIGEYGSAETGVVAFQCREKNYHVLTDCCYLEFFEIPATNYYEIIVTSLNSFGFPFIRYKTGDLVRDNRLFKCSCGLPFPAMSEIIGRMADIIETPEGVRVHCNIFSYFIKFLILEGFNIDKILFIQNTIQTIQVLIKQSLLDDPAFVKIIKKLIHERISPTMKVEFLEYCRPNDAAPSKLRYFISNLGSRNKNKQKG